MNRQSFTGGSGFIIAEATLDETQIIGMGGIHYPMLRVPLDLQFNQLHKQAVDYCFTQLDGRLIHEQLGVLADALPTKLQHVQRTHWPCGGRDSRYLEIPLDTKRINSLEKQRDGKDLTLLLELSLYAEEHGVIEGDEKLKRPAIWGLRWQHRLVTQFRVTVPRSVWIEKVLPAVGHGVVHIVELPAVPLAACKAMQHPFDALRQSQSLHAQGLYDESVAKCRIALEPFFDFVAVDPTHKESRRIPELKRSWETRLGKATYTWLNSVLGAIKDAANPTAHSPNPHFDQFESQMIQAITTTVIAYAARNLDGPPPS